MGIANLFSERFNNAFTLIVSLFYIFHKQLRIILNETFGIPEPLSHCLNIELGLIKVKINLMNIIFHYGIFEFLCFNLLEIVLVIFKDRERFNKRAPHGLNFLDLFNLPRVLSGLLRLGWTCMGNAANRFRSSIQVI